MTVGLVEGTAHYETDSSHTTWLPLSVLAAVDLIAIPGLCVSLASTARPPWRYRNWVSTKCFVIYVFCVDGVMCTTTSVGRTVHYDRLLDWTACLLRYWSLCSDNEACALCTTTSLVESRKLQNLGRRQPCAMDCSQLAASPHQAVSCRCELPPSCGTTTLWLIIFC